MGMLDEAIRDHFDLKRRNGADPAVVAIEEREALGDPAQREARAAQIASDRSREVAEEEVEEVVVVAEEPGAVAIVEHEVIDAPEALVEEETVIVEEAAASGGEVVEEDVIVEEVELPAEPPEQETQAFTIEESQEAVMPGPPSRPVGAPPPAAAEPPASGEPAAPEGQQEEEAHDELEQTPEFLEETPEHDRLWFERKPPRDFDF